VLRYSDARAFAAHLPPEQYPAEALTIALYREGGIRAVEIGGVMFGKPDPQNPGREILPLSTWCAWRFRGASTRTPTSST